MNNPLDSFLSMYSREAREISLTLRKLVLDIFPTALEQIDTKSRLILYGFERTCKGFVFAISPHMKYVNLIITTGAEVSDPHNLLAGSGKLVKHLKIRSEEETENPELRKLMLEAIEYCRNL